jgi:hypothetical protein
LGINAKAITPKGDNMNIVYYDKVIILDTNIIRTIIHSDPIAANITTCLVNNRLKFPVLLSDIALAELSCAILEDRLDFNTWRSKMDIIESFLFNEFPVLPGGKELTDIASNNISSATPFPGGLLFYQTAWQILSASKNLEDLKKPRQIPGHQYSVRLDKSIMQSVIKEERSRWNNFFVKIKSICVAENLQGISYLDLYAITKDYLSSHYNNLSLINNSDAMISSIARFAYLYLQNKSPYNPQSTKRRNDAFDFAILQAFVLPNTVILTTDGPFKKHVDLTNTLQKDRLVLADNIMSIIN